MLGLGVGIATESSRNSGPPVDPLAEYWNDDFTILDLTDSGLSGTLRLRAHKDTVEEIKLGGTAFSTIVLQHCPALTLLSGWPVTFYPGVGSLRHLTINHCDSLATVDFREQSNGQAIVSANLDNNASLATVNFDSGGFARDGALTSLSVAGCPLLETIQASGNQLAAIDLSDSEWLDSVSINGNSLASIVLPASSHNSPLSLIQLSDNPPLAALDIGTLHVTSVFVGSAHSISNFAPAAGAQIGGLTLSNGSVPIAIDLSQLPSGIVIDVRSQEVTALSYPADLSGATRLQLSNTVQHAIALPDLNDCPALTTLQWDRTGLTTVDISPCPLLQSVRFNFQALNQAAVDAVLAALDASGVNTGNCQLRFGTTSTPSAAGLTSKANLQGKGWTVTNN